MGFYHYDAASRWWKDRALSAQASGSDSKVLEVERLVARTLLRRILDYLIDQTIAVSRQKECRTNDALLRVAIGTEAQVEGIDMTAQTCFFLQLKVRGQPTESIHLVTHFRCSHVC